MLEPKIASVASVSLQGESPYIGGLGRAPRGLFHPQQQETRLAEGGGVDAGVRPGPVGDLEPTPRALAGKQGQYRISVAHKVSLGHMGRCRVSLILKRTSYCLVVASVEVRMHLTVDNMSEFHRQFCSLP